MMVRCSGRNGYGLVVGMERGGSYGGIMTTLDRAVNLCPCHYRCHGCINLWCFMQLLAPSLGWVCRGFAAHRPATLAPNLCALIHEFVGDSATEWNSGTPCCETRDLQYTAAENTEDRVQYTENVLQYTLKIRCNIYCRYGVIYTDDTVQYILMIRCNIYWWYGAIYTEDTMQYTENVLQYTLKTLCSILKIRCGMLKTCCSYVSATTHA